MARRIGFLGPPGTFGEQAALAHAPGAELVPFPSHAAIAAAVEGGEADEGVLAIENSINGSVAETLDILIHETSLQIQSELLVPILHNLVAAPGTKLESIDIVYSHTQALGQCRRFLETHLPEATLEAALSTSQAVELALEQERSAAISTERAAELFGGEILQRGIQDTDNNVTRFVILADGRMPPTGRDRTSIAVLFEGDEPGLLAGLLTAFAERGINCSKMESRPTRATFGEYVFLIDFEGHQDDPKCAEALAIVRSRSQKVSVFGSYPRAS